MTAKEVEDSLPAGSVALISNLFSPSDSVVAKVKLKSSFKDTNLSLIRRSTFSSTVPLIVNCLCPLPKKADPSLGLSTVSSGS